MQNIAERRNKSLNNIFINIFCIKIKLISDAFNNQSVLFDQDMQRKKKWEKHQTTRSNLFKRTKTSKHFFNNTGASFTNNWKLNALQTKTFAPLSYTKPTNLLLVPFFLLALLFLCLYHVRFESFYFCLSWSSMRNYSIEFGWKSSML